MSLTIWVKNALYVDMRETEGSLRYYVLTRCNAALWASVDVNITMLTEPNPGVFEVRGFESIVGQILPLDSLNNLGDINIGGGEDVLVVGSNIYFPPLECPIT